VEVHTSKQLLSTVLPATHVTTGAEAAEAA